MLKKLKTSSRGFTIIEVMIVLAVAALIILIVLLAVPALQRSSRNTTIKNDASTVASAISNYETNNNGSLPKYVGGTGSIKVGASASDSNAESVKVQGTTNVCMTSGSAAPATTTPSGYSPPSNPASGICTDGSVSAGSVWVLPGYTCGSPASATPTPNNRGVAVYYVTETGSSNQLQCIDT